MKYSEILDSLKLALTLRFHDKKAYQRKIAEVLDIDMVIVRQRLRGRLRFTLEEVSVICEKLDIPVNEIFYNYSCSLGEPMEFIQSDFSVLKQETQGVFNRTVELFSLAAGGEDSCFYSTCNTFPDTLFPSFPWLAGFSGLQWLFLNREFSSLRTLSEIVQERTTQMVMEQYISAIYSLKKSVYLLSSDMVRNYIGDVRRFYLAGFITRQETEYVISEIEGVLELFEKVCRTGRLENDKVVDIYYTDLFLPCDMCFLQSDRFEFGIIYPNLLNPVITKSPTVCSVMKKWFLSWRAGASLISLSGLHLRKQFMDKQRQQLEEFKMEVGV